MLHVGVPSISKRGGDLAWVPAEREETSKWV